MINAIYKRDEISVINDDGRSEMKMIFQWWGKIEKGSVTLYKRLRNRGYHVIAVNDSQDTAPRIDNETALALAYAILDDQGFGWKPYPENVPTDNYYFVLIKSTLNESEMVFYAKFNVRRNAWLSPFGGLLEDEDCKVIAYRTIPPYQPEAE